jgi:hypothetical protein
MLDHIVMDALSLFFLPMLHAYYFYYWVSHQTNSAIVKIQKGCFFQSIRFYFQAENRWSSAIQEITKVLPQLGIDVNYDIDSS